jgi:group I intron endonuclease
MKTGVYLITNVVNGKIYIGSATKSFKRRWAEHKKTLRGSRHINRYLQRSWSKYGEPAFTFDVLEETAPDDAVAAEEFWINYFIYIGAELLNISRYPTNGTRGIKRGPPSDAWRKEHSAKLKGRKANRSPEHQAKILEHNKTRMNDALKEKLSTALSKKPYNLVAPDGTIYRNIRALNKFALSQGFKRFTSFYNLVNGKVSHYKGWRLLVEDEITSKD